MSASKACGFDGLTLFSMMSTNFCLVGARAAWKIQPLTACRETKRYAGETGAFQYDTNQGCGFFTLEAMRTGTTHLQRKLAPILGRYIKSSPHHVIPMQARVTSSANGGQYTSPCEEFNTYRTQVVCSHALLKRNTRRKKGVLK